MDDIMKNIRLKTKQYIIETCTGANTNNIIAEYEKYLNWKKHYQRQKHLTDDKIEQNVNFLISKIIGQEPDNPDTEFEDKLDFILDEYQDEDDEAMLKLLSDLEQSEINWGQLAEGEVSIFFDDELKEGKFFNKKTLTPARIKSRKYYKQNRSRILKKKRILMNRISGKALQKKKKRKGKIGLTLKNRPVKKNHLKDSTLVGGAYVDGLSNVANTSSRPLSAARRIDRKYKDYKI